MSVAVLLALPCTFLMRNPPLAVRPAQKLPPVAMSLTVAAPALGAAVAASHLCTKVPIEMDRLGVEGPSIAELCCVRVV